MKILALGDFQGVFPATLRQRLKKETFDIIVGVGDYGGIKEWRPWVMKDLKSAKKGKRISAEEYFGKEGLKRIITKDNAAVKKIFKSLTAFKKPFLYVFGNGDDFWYTYKFDKASSPKEENKTFLKQLKNTYDITYSHKKINKYTFVGSGGYMDIDSYFNKKEWKETTAINYLRRLKRREKNKKHFFSLIKKSPGEKILVFHYPPKGAFDIIRDKKDNPMNGKSAGIAFFTQAIKKYKPRLVLCGHMHEYQGIKRMGKTLIINPGDAEKGKYAIIDFPDNRKNKVRAKFY